MDIIITWLEKNRRKIKIPQSKTCTHTIAVIFLRAIFLKTNHPKVACIICVSADFFAVHLVIVSFPGMHSMCPKVQFKTRLRQLYWIKYSSHWEFFCDFEDEFLIKSSSISILIPVILRNPFSPSFSQEGETWETAYILICMLRLRIVLERGLGSQEARMSRTEVKRDTEDWNPELLKNTAKTHTAHCLLHTAYLTPNYMQYIVIYSKIQ